MVSSQNQGALIVARDASFSRALHKDTAVSDAGFRAMLKKDKNAQKAAVDEYFKHWDNKEAHNETEKDREARKEEYSSLTKQYYNLATDLYEYGWSQSFHFCRFAYGEPFRQAIARHEHYLAYNIGIMPGMKVLDVGCGVGGPAREIAKFTGCSVTGVTLNEYQVERAKRYAARESLQDQVKFMQGDFMALPLGDESFDAVYAIEATVHAPSLEGVYGEVFRVLKPGGVFGVYEWVMTDAYDNDNLYHRKIRRDIEEGDGIANMVKADVALAAIRAVGFELLKHEDLSEKPDANPWYWPLDAGSWRHASSIGDLLTTFRMTRLGRVIMHNVIGALEGVGLAPPGTKKTADSMAKAADALVLGAKEHLFTPMFLMVARKPLQS